MTNVAQFLSALGSRIGLGQKMGKTFGGDRDYFATFGYPADAAIDFKRMMSYYRRGDIASRIINVQPDACWRTLPEIRSEDEKFVEAVETLKNSVRLFHHMKKVDRLSGIGEYAVLVMGTEGSKLVEEPKAATDADPSRLLFLNVFHQGNAAILETEEATDNARNGLPTMYGLNMTGSGSMLAEGSTKTTAVTGRELKVPWLRTIHVAEDLIEDRIHGTPRLLRVLNMLENLQKTVGGSAEMFWLIVGGILHADLSADVKATEAELAAFEEQLVESMHGLRRVLQTRGIELSRVAGEAPDPSGVYAAIKELIAATIPCPARVLFGSERGELASSQDQKEWQGQVNERRIQHVEPVIVRPTIDRFITLGILPPADYTIYWPPIEQETAGERTERAAKAAEAVSKIAPAGSADVVVRPWEFREHFLGLDPVPEPAPKGWEDDPFGDLENTTPPAPAPGGDSGDDDMGTEEDEA